jgi:malonate-semialdehyde dehydrogenase (acetylating)/methylmalonate-semialdehyde dehydrogenase
VSRERSDSRCEVGGVVGCGGWKRSAFGDTNQHGIEGVKFYTKIKTITARWPEGAVEDSAFVIPTMK